MTIRPIFAWYDFWVGLFYDRPKRRLYIFPVPMFGIVVQFSGDAMTDMEKAKATAAKDELVKLGVTNA